MMQKSRKIPLKGFKAAKEIKNKWDLCNGLMGEARCKVVDGAVGGEWIKELKKVVENPLELLL
jgi:hypothetical protein